MASAPRHQSVNIVDILRSLELRAADDLPELFARAFMVQNTRISASRSFVSRTSLLYAAVSQDAALLKVLQQSGFDVERFRGSLEPQAKLRALTRTTPNPRPEGIQVQGTKITTALKRYAERFPGRPVDARGLVFGILSAPEGGLIEDRVLAAGLDPKAAIELLASLMSPAWRDLEPFEVLQSFTLSERAVSVLGAARELATEHSAPVTSSLLLVALCDEGRRGSHGSERVVFEQLDYKDRKRYEEVSARYLAWYRHPEVGKASGDQITTRLLELIRFAQAIAGRTSGGAQIHVRHLIGALVAAMPEPSAEPGAWELIRQLGHEPSDLALALFVFLSEPPFGDDLAAWQRILRIGEPNASANATSSPLPSFDSDDLRDSDSDFLDIRPSVRAFASLFASQDLVPPLSVGLFGDWGSGKSFFMRKLRQRVDKLSEVARERRHAGQPTVLLGDIVQIEFNAWHYAEVNLWASLVTHIFDTLNRHFSPQQKLRDSWEALIRRLDEANRLQADSQGVLRQAENDLAATQERLRQSRIGLVRAVDLLWNNLDEKSRRDVAEVADGLGLDGVEEIKSEVVRHRAEARQLGDRFALYRQAAVRGLRSLAFVKTYAVVLLVLAAAGVGLLLAAPAAGRFADAVRSIIKLAGAAAAVLGGIVSWIRSALEKGSKVVAALQRVESTVREQLQASEEGAAVRAAEHAVERARDELEESRRKVLEVRSQVETLRPGRWLSDFLHERASSSDYHKYLGLTAIVRRDFEKLHQLMTQEPLRVDVDARAVVVVAGTEELDLAVLAHPLNEALAGRDLPLEPEKCSLGPPDETAWHVQDPGNARRIEVSRQGEDRRTCILSYDGPRIDRIVLYVDDLDRCPPARVVEVLEAVHLLLALPLFVVVVGVDVRWVTRSLELQYRDLWRRSPGTRVAGGRNPDTLAATPRDYLEKIFQVPFWLRPLDPLLTGKLLAGLLHRPSQEIPGSGSKDTGTATAIDRAPGTPPAARTAVTQAKTSAGRAVAGTVLSAESPGSSAESAPARDQVTGGAVPFAAPQESYAGAAAPSDAEDDNLDADATAAKLVLDIREIELVMNLARLVGRSPRAVKRFVNTYRLIRASVPVSDLKAFLGSAQAPGRHRLVLVLLGIAIGTPDKAEELERQIADLPPEVAIRGITKVDWKSIAPDLAQLFAIPNIQWTVADLRQEMTRVNQYSFRSPPVSGVESRVGPLSGEAS